MYNTLVVVQLAIQVRSLMSTWCACQDDFAIAIMALEDASRATGAYVSS